MKLPTPTPFRYTWLSLEGIITCLAVGFSLLFVNPLAGQGTTTKEEPAATPPTDRNQRRTLEQWYQNQHIDLGGGANYVTYRPEAEYDLDPKLIFLDADYQPCHITLVGGLTDTLPARIQLVDQVVEVATEGKIFQVKNKSLQSVITPDGRQFVPSRLPLVVGEPAPLLEVLATTSDRELYAHRRIEWRDPSRQRTPYDQGSYKKRPYREDLYYLSGPRGMQEVRKMRELLDLLPERQQRSANNYVRDHRLRNREEDYVDLLTFLSRLPNG
jgi:hypothetical protein